MYAQLVSYRNELKNKIIPKYKIIGIVAELIFSKEIFLKNKEIITFLDTVFSVQYKEYVLKSRTVIVSRCCRLIFYSDDIKYAEYRRMLFHYIEKLIKECKEKGNVAGEKNQFSGWIK